jgi:hypothetical protein
MCHEPNGARTLFAMTANGNDQSLSGSPAEIATIRSRLLESGDPRIMHVCVQTPSAIET